MSVDLLLLKYADTKKREDKCYAVAKCYAVDKGDVVVLKEGGRQLEVLNVARCVSNDVISIIREKNRIHTVKSAYMITEKDVSTGGIDDVIA